MNYGGKGYLRPYDGANGHFIDKENRKWEVLKITREKQNLYLRWCIDLVCLMIVYVICVVLCYF